MFRLHVVPAHGQPFDHLMAGDSLVIGRSSASDLLVADRYLSRRHARLYREGDGLVIEDLGTRNGTFVNGVRVTRPVPVGPGDEIRLSGSRLVLHRTDEEPAAGEGVPATTSTSESVYISASDILEDISADASEIEDEAALRRYAERLKLLNDVHQALGRSMARDELLELILDRAFDHLEPEEGMILLRRPDGDTYTAAVRTLPGIASCYLCSRTLIHNVVDKGQAALVLDAQSDQRFAAAASIIGSGVRSLVAAPLLDPEGPLGMIALSSRAHVHRFSEGDLELLTSLAAVAALRIRNVELAEEAAERRRLEEELALARRIQVALLAERLPEIPGYELYAGNVPSRGVSGDFYEVVERGGGEECLLMVADVSGKGIGASLLAAALEALCASPAQDGLPCDQIATKVSRLLYERTPPEKFATAFLGLLAPADGRLRYTNAGHNPGLLVRGSGTLEPLAATGLPLGLQPAAAYGAGEITLEAGDTLVLYTDGVTEAENPQGTEYGLGRLTEVCRDHRRKPLAELARAIEEDLGRFVLGVPYADDRTLLLVRRTAG